ARGDIARREDFPMRNALLPLVDSDKAVPGQRQAGGCQPGGGPDTGSGDDGIGVKPPSIVQLQPVWRAGSITAGDSDTLPGQGLGDAGDDTLAMPSQKLGAG